MFFDAQGREKNQIRRLSGGRNLETYFVRILVTYKLLVLGMMGAISKLCVVFGSELRQDEEFGHAVLMGAYRPLDAQRTSQPLERHPAT